MKIFLLLIAGILLATFSFAEDVYRGYSLEEATKFRQLFDLDNWGEGV